MDHSSIQPIPLSLTQSGMDLTEPKSLPIGPVVTWIQRWRGASAIVGAPVTGGPVRIFSHGPDPAPGRGLGGGCYEWTGHNAALLYVAVDGQLWRQSTDGGAVERLTAVDGSCRAPAVDQRTASGTSTFVVYVVDEAEVWLTSLLTGEHQRLDDGRHAFCYDPAVSPDASTVSWIGWSPPLMPWDGSVRIDCNLLDGSLIVRAVTDGAIQQPRFGPDGVGTHVHDASGWLNVYRGSSAVVLESLEHGGPTWGMGQRSYAFSGDGTRMAFTRNEAGFGTLNLVDLDTRVVTRLGRGVHGQISWMDDENTVVALRTGARTPTEIVAYPLDHDGRRTLAVGPNPLLSTSNLPEPELVEATSSDASTVLHARRFTAGEGRLLCWVHGGPTDQWQVDWRPRIAFWWSRGWDVLVVDPRGTTGHGRVYQQALHGAWGRIDVDDTADLIRHAHQAGWSTPETTAVIGGSSGGLTVLGVMADYPDLVAGGVASYPVSDLHALNEATHRFEEHYTDTLVAPLDGSAESDRLFRELSPLHRAHRIEAPLLLFHGTDDPVVPIGQSVALADRVRSSGGDVDFVVYDDEGHGFRQPDNVADEHARTEAFLDRLR